MGSGSRCSGSGTASIAANLAKSGHFDLSGDARGQIAVGDPGVAREAVSAEGFDLDRGKGGLGEEIG